MSLPFFLAIVSFILFVVTLFLGIKRKKLYLIIVCVCSLILTIIFVVIFTINLGNRLSQKLKSIELKVVERKPNEIYIALFNSIDSCTKIQSAFDQKVPQIDNGIFLEFTTCPKELKRLLAFNKFNFETVHLKDSTSKYSDYTYPAWFNTKNLGSSYIKASYLDEMNPGTAKEFLFSLDSTKVFYADISE